MEKADNCMNCINTNAFLIIKKFKIEERGLTGRNKINHEGEEEYGNQQNYTQTKGGGGDNKVEEKKKSS